MTKPQQVSKILVFHAGALGDLVNTLPAIHALKKAFPAAVITAAGSLSSLSLLAEADLVDRALSIDGHGFHALFSGRALPASLRDLLLDHDLAVSWIRDPRLVEALVKTGLKTAALRGPFPPPSGRGHVADYMARPLIDLGITAVDQNPRLSLPESMRERGPRFSGIVIHPGSGSEHKNWPARRFAAAALELEEKTDLPLALLQGPADEKAAGELDGILGGRLAARFKDLDLTGLAALLSGAALVVGNDSGVIHLAGALRAPVVAVFGPTDPAVWGVRQAHAANLAVMCECSPCAPEKMRACPDKTCLQAVSPEMVVRAGIELLGRRSS